MAVQTDFMVVIEDRPGIVARVGSALGRAGINIEGVCGLTSGSMGILHLLLDNEKVDAARAALESSGLEIHTERDVWVADCPDVPGELGRLMRRLADADINCDLVYVSTTGKVVIGAPDFERAARLLDRANSSAPPA
jgi:hypothetical protein